MHAIPSPASRVLLVDDHAFFRDGVRALIQGAGDFIVVGEAATGDEAIALHRALKPDVAVIDMQMPDMGGIEIIARIRDDTADARFLVLTGSDTPSLAQRVARAGAGACVQKETARRELLPALRTVVRAAAPARAAPVDSTPMLTHREREIMRLVAAGHANRSLAAELRISEETVKSHLTKIRFKLGASDRAQSVAIALALHEIPMPVAPPPVPDRE